jgi:LysR family transcriptional regulator, nod-box dependent transcriptional activator
MTGPSLARLDLNLLVSLDALLTERSVTKAAERLGLSQPALSASLSRLRIHFDDQLLMRDGNAYRLTPLASRLVEQAATTLESARKLFANEAAFDPASSKREFTVYGSDFSFATVGSRVSSLVRDEAPGVRFRFMHHTPAIVDDAMHTLRSVDGILLPHGFTIGLPCIDVYEADWVCIVSTENSAVGERLTMDNLRELPWVFTYQSRSAYTPAARQLQLIGIEPHIDVVVEGFLALPYFIAGTDRIGLIQASLAERATAGGGLRALPAPFDPGHLAGALWWHPVHEEDPSHIWMREQFLRAGRPTG